MDASSKTEVAKATIKF